MEADDEWFYENVVTYADPSRPSRAARGPSASWQNWWQARWYDADTPCARVARGQGFVISAAQARELDMSRDDLRRELRRGALTRVARGVVSPVTIPPTPRPIADRRRHALVAAAAALLRQNAAASGASAAIMHGLPTVRVPQLPTLTAAMTTTGQRGHARISRASLPEADTTRWFGAPVTTVARTLVDLARTDRIDGLIAADSALHQRLITADDLEPALRSARGWPGARRAVDVLQLASPLAESALESLVRITLLDSGFPVPELQIEIGGYRLDFLWPEQRVALEADGRGKYTDDQLWREKRREQRLRRLGLTVLRVTWWDVTANWPETSEHLARELRLAHRVGVSGTG